MQSHRFLVLLGATLALVYGLFWHWQTPGDSGRMNQAEVDNYLAILDRDLPLPADEKELFLKRMRAWGEADDGKPVLMLNAMRYYDKLVPVPGAPEFSGTPHEANDFYEAAIAPFVSKLGAYPLIAGDVVGITEGGKQHSNIAGFGPTLDDWGRIIVMRYPNRRAFFRLVSDPEYLKVAPYKMIALEVGLAPLKPEIIVPELRLSLAALLLMLFLGIGWWRAARQH